MDNSQHIKLYHQLILNWLRRAKGSQFSIN